MWWLCCQLLAPECNFTVSFETKWFMTQALPLVLAVSIVTIVLATRLLQFLQRFVFHVVPFGATAQLSLVDASIGILITGVYHLYFGASRAVLTVSRLLCAAFRCSSTSARQRSWRCCAHVSTVPRSGRSVYPRTL